MLKTNAKFVLRNHLAEQAIQQAKRKDFSELATLLRLLESPFDEHPVSKLMPTFRLIGPAASKSVAVHDDLLACWCSTSNLRHTDDSPASLNFTPS